MYCKENEIEIDDEAKLCPQSDDSKTKKGDFRKVRAVYCFFSLSFIFLTTLTITYVLNAVLYLDSIEIELGIYEILSLFSPALVCLLIDIIGIPVSLLYTTYRKLGKDLKTPLIVFACIFSIVAGVIMLFTKKEDLTTNNKSN